MKRAPEYSKKIEIDVSFYVISYFATAPYVPSKKI